MKTISPETFEVDSNGVTLRGLCYGSTDFPAVLMIHGSRDLSWGLAPIAEKLAKQYRVIVPDLRGHGDSENPGCYTLPYFMADIHAVITQLQLDKPALIGHSLGGHIAGRYTAVFPEHISAAVIAEGMGPPLPQEQRDEARRRERFRQQMERLLIPVRPLRPMTDLNDAAERLLRNNPKLGKSRALFLAEKGTTIQDDGSLLWNWDPNIDSLWSTVDQAHSELAWTWIECPVLIVTAEQSLTYWTRNDISTELSDDYFRQEVERRVAIFQNVQHEWIEDSGHMLHYDQPERFANALLKFLGQAFQ
ncbi:MAG: alpha/beta hydrolase [Pseudomonadota bacterium]